MSALESGLDLLELPSELVDMVLELVGRGSLASLLLGAALVCRRLCELAADQRLWRTLVLRQWCNLVGEVDGGVVGERVHGRGCVAGFDWRRFYREKLLVMTTSFAVRPSCYSVTVLSV